MIVKLIDGDFSNPPKNSILEAVLKVGDPLPEEGKEYEVIGSSALGYELAGFDYSAYPGGIMLFKKERFEIVDDTFVPNAIHDGQLVREERLYLSFSMPSEFITKLPRKKKKMIKKYGQFFTYKNIKTKR